MTILVITIIAILIITGIIKEHDKKCQKQHPNPKKEEAKLYDEEIEAGLKAVNDEIEEINTIRYAYAPKWMFTQNEKQAYYKLNEIARKHNLVVFAKVRLLDLVTPNKNNAKYKSNLYRIQAKHVDFVLTKENLVAKYIIELDDGSHDTEDRQERDRFVDLVLTTSGYKVLRTRAINAEEIEKFIAQQ